MSLMDILSCIWRHKMVLVWVNVGLLVVALLAVQLLPKWRSEVMVVIARIDGKVVMEDQRLAVYLTEKYGKQGVLLEKGVQDGYLLVNVYADNAAELSEMVDSLSKEVASKVNVTYEGIIEKMMRNIDDWDGIYKQTCDHTKVNEIKGFNVVGGSPCVAIMQEIFKIKMTINNEGTYPTYATIRKFKPNFNYFKIVILSLMLGVTIGVIAILLNHLLRLTRFGKDTNISGSGI